MLIIKRLSAPGPVLQVLELTALVPPMWSLLAVLLQALVATLVAWTIADLACALHTSVNELITSCMNSYHGPSSLRAQSPLHSHDPPNCLGRFSLGT